MSTAVASSSHGAGAHRSTHAGLSSRLWLLCLVVLCLALPAGAALAEEPSPLVEPVSDLAGVIPDPGDRAKIEDAFAVIEDRHGVALHVVFVDTFSGTDAFAWTDATFAATGLGRNDFLLAVAMNDRAYGYVVKDEFPLGAPALERVVAAATPHLAENATRASTALSAAMGRELRPDSITAAASATEDAIAATDRVVGITFLVCMLVAAVWAAAWVRDLFRPPASPWDPATPRRPTQQMSTASESARSSTSSSDRWSSSGSSWSSSSSRGGGGSRGGSGTF